MDEFYKKKMRSFFMIKFLMILFVTVSLQYGFAASAQKVNLNYTTSSLKEIFNAIKKQTGFGFIYQAGVLDDSTPVTVKLENASLEEALTKCLENQGLIFNIKAENIVIAFKKNIRQSGTNKVLLQDEELKGRVLDKTGQGIPSVTVALKGTILKTMTDTEGRFKLLASGTKNKTLIFTSIGFLDKEISINDPAKTINVTLEEAVQTMKDAVITGIYTRNKESFTGSSATYSVKELKMVGNQNILQSLRTLDPSFAILDNNKRGSDPNNMPDINVRGKTSVIGLSQEYENDPNQPLFILDGFETTLKVINELNIDRVESITILKDAASTAIYGSRSANGVIVVETKRPEAGTFKVNYSLNTSFSFADLSDYNLMDASEKLTFERLSGYYGTLDENGVITNEIGSELYNKRLAESKRGVDTYWLNEPLRFGISQNHNLYAEGGDDKMRYGLGLNYGNSQGVMDGSSRNTINGNIRMVYRSGNFSFSNNLNIDNSMANRESVAFSSYTSANPYFRKHDSYGNISKVLEVDDGQKVFNPLYDASLNNFNRSPQFGVRNNLDIDWTARPEFRLRGRFSINKSSGQNQVFFGPSSTQYDGTTIIDRGSYTATRSDVLGYNGDLSATYGKLLADKHMINAVAGLRLDHSERINNGFNVMGFMDDNFSNPSLSKGYTTGSKPVYSETERRSISYYTNFGYAYDNKYLIDANFRSDGSSLFGASNKFTATWAVGLAWNVYQEEFFKNIPFISYFKLRASVGNPGNQNFDSRMTMDIYNYNSSFQNPFGLSSLINSWGNNNLDWQKTLDKNIGLDIEVLDKRLRFNIDYFDKNTDPLLVFVEVPPSTGTNTVPMNIGAQSTTGVSAAITYQMVKTEKSMWSLNANLRNLNMKYYGIGTSLDKFNRENKSKTLLRYYDGGSPTDMWAVKSAGIDPGTGREVFIKKDGTQTFLHDYADEVIVGNTSPKLEGIIGTSYYYNRFSVSINFRYRLGGQIFLNALYNKVENISADKLLYNQDKRALYERWQNPGDVAKYKGISLTDNTPISSRFVVDENVLSAESISAGYEFKDAWLKKLGLSSLSIRGYMNEIFRISTVKEERGTDYPFARSVSFSLGARF